MQDARIAHLLASSESRWDDWTAQLGSPGCHRDVRLACKNGFVAWNGLALALWSPLLRAAVGDGGGVCPDCPGGRSVVLLPDFRADDVRRALEWTLSGTVSASDGARVLEVLLALGAALPTATAMELDEGEAEAINATTESNSEGARSCRHCGDKFSGRMKTEFHEEVCEDGLRGWSPGAGKAAEGKVDEVEDIDLDSSRGNAEAAFDPDEWETSEEEEEPQPAASPSQMPEFDSVYIDDGGSHEDKPDEEREGDDRVNVGGKGRAVVIRLKKDPGNMSKAKRQTPLARPGPSTCTDRLRCPEPGCDYATGKKVYLHDHLVRSHLKDELMREHAEAIKASVKGNSFTCSRCGFKSAKKSSHNVKVQFLRHFTKRHDAMTKYYLDFDNERSSQVYRCPIFRCTKTYDKYDSLNYHLISNHCGKKLLELWPDNQANCPFCSRSIPTQSTSRNYDSTKMFKLRHLGSTHGKLNDFISCDARLQLKRMRMVAK